MTPMFHIRSLPLPVLLFVLLAGGPAGIFGTAFSQANGAETEEDQPGTLHSGLQAGQTPLPFQVKDCTGPAAGKRLCYYCRYGDRPVVSIFARELTDEAAVLVKRVDQLVAERRDRRLAAFVVYLGEASFAAEKQLRDVARRQGLEHTPLTLFADVPGKLTDTYQIAPEAQITLMMWDHSEVKINRALATAKPSAATVQSILDALRGALEPK